MPRILTRAPERAPWRVLLGILCLAFVVVCGTAAASHAHPLGDTGHTDCSLCVVAHSAAQLSGTAVEVVALPVTAEVPDAPCPPRARTLPRSALVTRPPPVAGSLA